MNELQKVEPGAYNLANPSDLMNFSKVLKNYLKANSLTTEIAGNTYVNVDGWKFAGNNFQLSAVCEEPKQISEGETIYILYHEVTKKGRHGPYKTTVPFHVTTDRKESNYTARHNKTDKRIAKTHFSYSCQCNIIRLTDGAVVSSGTGICSNMEIKKLDFDQYAVASMAQTRAIGKAYRNIIGYVMNNAGYESTPAEEMEGVTPQDPGINQDVQKVRILNDVQFKKYLAGLKTGDVEIGDAEKNGYTLTPEQSEAVNKLKA